MFTHCSFSPWCFLPLDYVIQYVGYQKVQMTAPQKALCYTDIS